MTIKDPLYSDEYTFEDLTDEDSCIRSIHQTIVFNLLEDIRCLKEEIQCLKEVIKVHQATDLRRAH